MNVKTEGQITPVLYRIFSTPGLVHMYDGFGNDGEVMIVKVMHYSLSVGAVLKEMFMP